MVNFTQIMFNFIIPGDMVGFTDAALDSQSQFRLFVQKYGNRWRAVTIGNLLSGNKLKVIEVEIPNCSDPGRQWFCPSLLEVKEPTYLF